MQKQVLIVKVIWWIQNVNVSITNTSILWKVGLFVINNSHNQLVTENTVFVVLTDCGVWTVCTSRELAEEDELEAFMLHQSDIRIEEWVVKGSQKQTLDALLTKCVVNNRHDEIITDVQGRE
jgi:hypothetical protein